MMLDIVILSNRPKVSLDLYDASIDGPGLSDDSLRLCMMFPPGQ